MFNNAGDRGSWKAEFRGQVRLAEEEEGVALGDPLKEG